ncbi:MAG TPA: hypothetical protein VLB10_05575 [Gammaproteobacteria bacterium]|jgi:hypothetical protein|nr:hypothetical protein [Gammaproteobacteria bacterium]
MNEYFSDRQPGITRDNRISDDGLQRLEKQLQRGGQISDAVLAQWIRRYGDAAREIIRSAGRYRDDLG